MGNLEPVREMMGRIVGCLTVEGHHRRWHTRSAPQLRAPPIPYGRDFDLVHTPANGFFEAMKVHVFSCPSEG